MMKKLNLIYALLSLCFITNIELLNAQGFTIQKSSSDLNNSKKTISIKDPNNATTVLRDKDGRFLAWLNVQDKGNFIGQILVAIDNKNHILSYVELNPKANKIKDLGENVLLTIAEVSDLPKGLFYWKQDVNNPNSLQGNVQPSKKNRFANVGFIKNSSTGVWETQKGSGLSKLKPSEWNPKLEKYAHPTEDVENAVKNF